MSAPAPPSSERVFPVGHLLGLRTDVPTIEVRLGPDPVDLTAEEFSVWALAHGDPHGQAEVWGPDDVVAGAVGAGLADAADHLAALEQRGLVLRAAPGQPSARELADRVRLVPLALGLGNTAQQPRLYAVGRPGRPQALLTTAMYDLYQWAHLETSLWRACEASAITAARAGAVDPLTTDPAALLDSLVESLHGLLLPGTAMLDTWGVTP